MVDLQAAALVISFTLIPSSFTPILFYSFPFPYPLHPPSSPLSILSPIIKLSQLYSPSIPHNIIAVEKSKNRFKEGGKRIPEFTRESRGHGGREHATSGPIRPIVSRITIHWPSFYNVVTGKTLALPNLIALQHIPLSPAGVIAKRPAPIALPNSCAA